MPNSEQDVNRSLIELIRRIHALEIFNERYFKGFLSPTSTPSASSVPISNAEGDLNDWIDIDALVDTILHNETLGIQGGAADDYYHLTAVKHGYINQSVISGASPVFDGANFTGMDADDVDIADAGLIITATEVEGALQENRTAINLNTAKETNVPTALSTGTVTPATYGITSDGGADDIVLPEADTDNAGLLGADKWDEIVANTDKVTNANHTGEVTGATELTISNNAVTLGKIQRIAINKVLGRGLGALGDADKDWRPSASDGDGSNLIVGNHGGRLYTSSTYGASWVERRPAGDVDLYWWGVASDDDGSHLIATVDSGRVYTSDDFGVTWTERQPAGNFDKNWRTPASDGDGSNLIVGVYSGRLYTSDDFGVTWTERQPAGNVDKAWMAVSSNSDGANLIAAAWSGRLYTSINGGVDWTERQPAGAADVAWTVVNSDGDGSHLLAAIYIGRLYISIDFGVTWTERRPAGDTDQQWRMASSDEDGLKLIAGVWGGRLYTSINNGVDWTERRPAGDANKNWRGSGSSSDGVRLIACNAGGRIYISGDSGVTWIDPATVGLVEEIPCTPAGRALIDDADAAAQRATLNVRPINKPFYLESWIVIPGTTGCILLKNLSAGASLDYPRIGLIGMSTGATNNNVAQIYNDYPTLPAKVGMTMYLGTQRGGTVLTDSSCILGLWATTTKPPIMTDAHIGWNIINGAIWATHCDGTNAEVATDTGITYSANWESHVLYIDYYDASTLRFYVDTVLRATHTTNLPSFDPYLLFLGIKTTSAANKQFLLKTLMIHIP